MVEPSLMQLCHLLYYRWWGGDGRILWPKKGDPRYIIFGLRIYHFLNGVGEGGCWLSHPWCSHVVFRLMVEGDDCMIMQPYNQKLNSTICYQLIVINVERERSKIISLKLCLSWTPPLSHSILTFGSLPPHITQLSLSKPTPPPPIGEWYDFWTLPKRGGGEARRRF